MEEPKKSSDGQPHVHLFGKEINNQSDHSHQSEKAVDQKNHRKSRWEGYCHDHTCYHGHGSSALWGLILIFGGLILVLNNAGAIPWDFWNSITPLWPLILVILGLRVIAGRSIISNFLVFLVTLALVLIVILYGLIAIRSPIADAFIEKFGGSVGSFQEIQNRQPTWQDSY